MVHHVVVGFEHAPPVGARAQGFEALVVGQFCKAYVPAPSEALGVAVDLHGVIRALGFGRAAVKAPIRCAGGCMARLKKREVAE